MLPYFNVPLEGHDRFDCTYNYTDLCYPISMFPWKVMTGLTAHIIILTYATLFQCSLGRSHDRFDCTCNYKQIIRRGIFKHVAMARR